MWSRGSGAQFHRQWPTPQLQIFHRQWSIQHYISRQFGLTPRSNRVLRVGSSQSRNFLERQQNRPLDSRTLDCKHVATFAERRCHFLGCSQGLTVPAPPSTVEGAVHSHVNIFQPSDDEMSSTLSDTESCEVEEPAAHRRRLRLTWRQLPLQGDVKVAAHLVERRVGPVAVGGPVPRSILQQKWSPINVPLIWGAAGTGETTPVFEWLMGEASRVPDQVQFHDGHTDVCNAVREGWHVLREVMRTWGIEDRSDLSDWLG